MNTIEETFVEGWAAPFGGPANGRDLHGEHFSKRTDFMVGRHTDRPLLYEHTFDAEIGKERIGTVVEHRVTDLGLWVRAQLDRRSKYYDFIRALIEKGALSFSTGSIPALVKVVNGEILAWPWEETSLTPTPANPTALVRLAVQPKRLSPAVVEELTAVKRNLRRREVQDLAAIRRDVERATGGRAMYAEFLRTSARMNGVAV